MPCPHFEPRQIATDARHPAARLPLLDEYDGLCHACATPAQVPFELRFSCCNCGYSHGRCDRVSSSEFASCLRYTVLEQTADVLRVLCIEEQDYAPQRWQTIEYLMTTGNLKPDLPDLCRRAQVLAFCRSYLKRFRE